MKELTKEDEEFLAKILTMQIKKSEWVLKNTEDDMKKMLDKLEDG